MGTHARTLWTATTTERSLALGGALAALLLTAAPASAVMPPSYYPSGPQRGVALGTVTGGGWTQCFKQLYNQGTPAVASVLAGCKGEYMLLAARPVNSTTFDLLAAAPRADVIFDTGRPATTPDYDTPHDANGTGWYFNDSWSWGFAKQGDPISRNACDFNPTVNVELRLCWHTGSGQMRSGYRSGATILNGSTSWERLIFVSDGIDNDPPTVTSAAADTLGDEGDTLATAGRFADADGDALMLTADNAHGVFTSNPDGSWTWRLATDDDVPRQTVTVTATDAKGAIATDSFDYGAANVAPKVKLSAANPGSLDESRTEHTFAYAISDPGRDTVDAVQTSCGSGGEKVDGSDAYSDSDGSFRCVFAHGPAQPTVSAAATDSDGDTGDTDAADVTVADAPIHATAGEPITTRPAYDGPVATFTDEADGPAAEFSAVVRWGDGSASSAGVVSGPDAGGKLTVSGSHTYAETGPRTVTVEVISAGGSTDSASTQALVYAFATPANATFTISEAAAAQDARVTWWGSQWDKQNPFPNGVKVPGSFKGFVEAAAGMAAPACGTTWTSTSSGGSGSQPAAVPAYMAVAVVSRIAKSGSTIAGDVKRVVVVKTQPGYEPNPGHAGTGTVVASVC